MGILAEPPGFLTTNNADVNNMRKLLPILLGLLLLLPAASAEVTIVTSFYPVWLLTRSLTDGLEDMTVQNLAAPDTGCLHDYSLRPSDMAVLSRADALLINGAGMESFLPVVLDACPDLTVVDASEGIPMLEEADAEEIGEEEEEEEEEGDPHLWLDPARASRMAENLAAGLIEIVPEHADRITANLQALQADLEALSADLLSGVSDLSRQDVIIFHEALPYLAEACGLNPVAVVNKESDDALTTSMLVQIVRFIDDCGEPPLVMKTLETDPYIEVLETETGVRYCELDPLTSGPEDPPLDYYESVMRDNLRILREGLSD